MKRKNKVKFVISLFLAALFVFSSLCACTAENMSAELLRKEESGDFKSEGEIINSSETFETDESSATSDASITENDNDSSVESKSDDFESNVISDVSPSKDSSNSQGNNKPPRGEKPKDESYNPLVSIPKTLEADSIDSYFDNSVFIGYSIMMHFGKYVSQWRVEVDESIMGKSIYCCGVGMNFTNNRLQTPETAGNVLPRYRGESYNFADLPEATNSDTIYIGLMGFTELKYSTLENCVTYAINEAIAGIEKIQSKNPNVTIVILSSTYNTGLYATGELDPERNHNENTRLYNIGVLQYCNEKGIDFIDVSTSMLDGRGFMPVKYASDSDYHIRKEPFKIWINIFRDYARKKQDGTWKNIDTMPPLVAK